MGHRSADESHWQRVSSGLVARSRFLTTTTRVEQEGGGEAP
jgi:hypothetical protein